MNRHGRPTFAAATMLVAAILAAAPAGFAAEVEPPARIANIYGGRNHQPTRAQVDERERAAGVQPDAGRQAADDATVQRLFDALTRRARAG